MRIIRLRFPIVSRTDKWRYDGVPSSRPFCSGAPIEIARVLMQERGQNSIGEQAFADAAREVSPESLAVSFCTLAVIRGISGLLNTGPCSLDREESWVGETFVGYVVLH